MGLCPLCNGKKNLRSRRACVKTSPQSFFSARINQLFLLPLSVFVGNNKRPSQLLKCTIMTGKHAHLDAASSAHKAEAHAKPTASATAASATSSGSKPTASHFDSDPELQELMEFLKFAHKAAGSYNGTVSFCFDFVRLLSESSVNQKRALCLSWFVCLFVGRL